MRFSPLRFPHLTRLDARAAVLASRMGGRMKLRGMGRNSQSAFGVKAPEWGLCMKQSGIGPVVVVVTAVALLWGLSGCSQQAQQPQQPQEVQQQQQQQPQQAQQPQQPQQPQQQQQQQQLSTEQLKELQTQLKSAGYFTGDPNGKFDPETYAALKKFQTDHKLNPDGSFSAETIAELAKIR